MGAMCVAAAVVACCVCVEAGAAPRQPAFKANRVEVRYVEPKTAELKPVFQLLRQQRALEKLRDLLSPIRLPQTLVLQTLSCDGVLNAWYDKGTVSVCYELIDQFWQNMPDKTTPEGIAPVDAVIGPVVSVFLHEAGHALFDLLKFPVLGGEETAADQFAAYFMLQFEKDEARRLIGGAAYQYKEALSSPTVTTALQQFSDEHGTKAQRFYNLLCLAFGSDQELYGDIVSRGFLPKARADRCPADYAKVANSIAALIGPYVDLKLAAKQPRRWLIPADTKPVLWRAQ